MSYKRFEELSQEWMKDPEYKTLYQSLDEEFNLAKTLIAARVRAHLTQKEIAERMHTKQSFISRLESGKYKFSLDTLARYAAATGSKIEFRLIEKRTEIG